ASCFCDRCLKPNSLFRWTLCQNKSSNFQEFLARAQQKIIAEESISVPNFSFTPKELTPDGDNKKKNNKKIPNSKFGKIQFGGPSKGDSGDPEVRMAKKQYAEDRKLGYQNVYTAGAATIFEELKGKGIIPDPRPIRTPEDQLDKSKYCAYHKSPDHNTDECLSLLSVLLRLIENPQVKRFAKNSNFKCKTRPTVVLDDDDDEAEINPKRVRPGDKEVFMLTPEESTNKMVKQTQFDFSSTYGDFIPRVNTNDGRPPLSRRQAKAYARGAYYLGKRVVTTDLRDTINSRNCPITFTADDANLFAHPHTDALIVTAQIGHIPVHRIL
ncbi:Unknown protein, partial [Striga hermonthica]